MSNNEPSWEYTRQRVDNRLDGALALPWLAYLGGLFDRDPGLIGMGLGFWGLAVAIWTPWIVLRVRMSRPTGDTARAAAVLGVGLLPWPFAIFAVAWLETWAGALAGFPLIYLWGAGAMAMAAFQWPRVTAAQRAGLLVAGGLSYGVVAAGFFVFLAADLAGGGSLLSAIALLLGGGAGVAALAVLIAAARPYAPSRF